MRPLGDELCYTEDSKGDGEGSNTINNLFCVIAGVMRTGYFRRPP